MLTCGQEMMTFAALAVKNLDKSASAGITSFVTAMMNHDGGFKGRSDVSDLYYTVFGTGCMLALNHKFSLLRTAGYINSFKSGDALDFIHLTCLARCLGGIPGTGHRREEVLSRINEYRSADGGFNHQYKDAQCGSVYACFLAWLAFEDAGFELPSVAGLATCLDGLRSGDGAYANQPDLPTGTTTVTSAAVVLLNRLGMKVDASAGDWLLKRCHPGGGFSAGTMAPMPDLLSTATTVYALNVMMRPLSGIKENCLDFVENMWEESGGFCGSTSDRRPDVEYTFYALLAMGCLLSAEDDGMTG